MYPCLRATLLLCFLTTPGWSVPLVIYDNLAQPQTSSATVDAFYSQAQAFSTGAGSGPITKATLLLQQDVAGSITLDIFSSATGAIPTAFVGSLALSSGLSATLSLVTFTGSVDVAANADYFAVLRPTTGGYRWGYTYSSTGSGVGFESNYAYSNNLGVTWIAGSYQEPFQMSITQQVVPELDATSAPLAFTGLAILLMTLKRKRHDPRAESSPH